MVEESTKQLEVLKSVDLPDQAKIALSQLSRNIALLNNTVFDIKSTNNDLLNLSLAQYNKALDDRRDVWINSTHLPNGVKNELKKLMLIMSDQKVLIQQKLDFPC